MNVPFPQAKVNIACQSLTTINSHLRKSTFSADPLIQVSRAQSRETLGHQILKNVQRKLGYSNEFVHFVYNRKPL
jgi:hypothetical protein